MIIVRDLFGRNTRKVIAEKLATPKFNYQAIFAILILLKQTSQIFGFINQTFPTIPIYQDCGMSDYDLPLAMMYDESKSKIVLRRQDYPEAHLDCFDEFSPEETIAFERLQRLVFDEDQRLEQLGLDGPNSRREKWHYSYNANDQLPVVKPSVLPPSALVNAMIGKDTHRVGNNGEVSLWALTDLTRPRPMLDGAGVFKAFVLLFLL